MADPKKLGTYNAKNEVETWPEVDVFGRPYARENATLYRQPGGFVVVPPDGFRRMDEDMLKEFTPAPLQTPLTPEDS